MSEQVISSGLGPLAPPTPRARRARGRSSRLAPGPRIPYAMAIGPLALLALWALASATGLLDPRVLSAPWSVVARMIELTVDGRLQANLATSALRAGAGLGLGVFVGSLLALISGLSRIGEALIDGPVQAKRAIPTLALIPLLILWFGIGEQMKIIAIAVGAGVQMYLHAHAGLRGIDARYVELAEMVRLSRYQFIRKIALPGALPEFILGLRIAVTSSWLVLVAVEQINATSGIGHMMSLARSYGQTETIVVGLVVYGLFGVVSDTLLRWIEKRALSWRRSLSG